MKTVVIVLVLLLPRWADAQIVPPSSPAVQQAAHVASWVTVLTLEGLDTYASWRSPDRKRAFILQGVRVATVEGSTALIKHFYPQPRPCTPLHMCGSDGEQSGFPSGHMSLACSTLGGPSLAVVIPLAGATAFGRWAAWRHFPGQLAAGCAVGLLASRIR